MGDNSEILISIHKTHPLITFEFPDGNPMQLPKESLIKESEYFRTLCENDTENQYIAINDFDLNKSSLLKHFLVSLANGFKNILAELPIEDSLQVLEFNHLLKLNPDSIKSITGYLANFRYDVIQRDYFHYWNYKFIQFPTVEVVAKNEKNLKVVLDWLNEDTWQENILICSQEFLLCKEFLLKHPEIFPKDTKDLLLIISKYKIAYKIIDLKSLLRSLQPTPIMKQLYTLKY